MCPARARVRGRRRGSTRLPSTRDAIYTDPQERTEGRMTEAEFWQIVAQSAAAARGNDKDQRLWLAHTLSRLDDRDISEFGAYHAHFARLAEGSPTVSIVRTLAWDSGTLRPDDPVEGCGGDSHFYWAHWLVAQGAELLRAALTDPEAVAALRPSPLPSYDSSFEWYLYLRGDAWFLRHGTREGEEAFDALETPVKPSRWKVARPRTLATWRDVVARYPVITQAWGFRLKGDRARR